MSHYFPIFLPSLFFRMPLSGCGKSIPFIIMRKNSLLHIVPLFSLLLSYHPSLIPSLPIFQDASFWLWQKYSIYNYVKTVNNVSWSEVHYSVETDHQKPSWNTNFSKFSVRGRGDPLPHPPPFATKGSISSEMPHIKILNLRLRSKVPTMTFKIWNLMHTCNGGGRVKVECSSIITTCRWGGGCPGVLVRGVPLCLETNPPARRPAYGPENGSKRFTVY